MLPSLIRLVGLDQKQIANEAGVAPETFSRILHGHSMPSERTIRRLEEAILQHLTAQVE